MQQRNYIAKILINSILLSILLFTFSRLLFLSFNLNTFAHFGFAKISKALIYGILFDCVYLFYALSPFIILHILPFSFKIKKRVQLISKIYFLTVVGIGIMLNLIDSVFFQFTKKRTGKELYYMITDEGNPLGSYFIDYWYLLVILSLFIYLANRFYPKLKQLYIKKFEFKDLPLLLLIIIISIMGMRGSIGLKPLSSIDASKYSGMGMEALTLNTPFQIFSSLEAKKPNNPFPDTAITAEFEKELNKNYNSNKVVENKKNIVLIILESFGRNHIGFLTDNKNGEESATPFLDSFSKSCLVFPNCYANGRKSIDAVPALFASLPSLLDQSFIHSWYQANTIKGVHHFLHKEGYNSSFYHGASNGTMGFESFLKKTGEIDYYGLNEYSGNKKTDYDGNWGIYDHYYLHYFNEELKKKEQPYFSTVFTLSSHPPHKIPPNFENNLPNISDIVLKSISYTDFSLKQFFRERAKSHDNENTLYILIGDHTSNANNDYFYSAKGQMELFCMIYDPSKQIKPGINNKVVQQLDIMPTILNLVNFQDSFFSLGNSFFDLSNQGKAFFEIYGAYHIVQNEHIYSENTSGDKDFKFQPKENYKLTIPFTTNIELENQMKNELKQNIETYFERMDKNKFY